MSTPKPHHWTTTLSSLAGGTLKTSGAIVGATGRGLGTTISEAAGAKHTHIRSFGDGLGKVGSGVQRGSEGAGRGVEDAGRGHDRRANSRDFGEGFDGSGPGSDPPARRSGEVGRASGEYRRSGEFERGRDSGQGSHFDSRRGDGYAHGGYQQRDNNGHGPPRDNYMYAPPSQGSYGHSGGDYASNTNYGPPQGDYTRNNGPQYDRHNEYERGNGYGGSNAPSLPPRKEGGYNNMPGGYAPPAGRPEY